MMLVFHELLALMVCGASLKDVVIVECFLVRRRGACGPGIGTVCLTGPASTCWTISDKIMNLAVL